MGVLRALGFSKNSESQNGKEEKEHSMETLQCHSLISLVAQIFIKHHSFFHGWGGVLYLIPYIQRLRLGSFHVPVVPDRSVNPGIVASVGGVWEHRCTYYSCEFGISSSYTEPEIQQEADSEQKVTIC